ncbi:MAG: (2Fe-2S) ferredoxin domain-containing protein [Cytophagaceae bacterium]|nr:(2Fe-2S) ferredoxin domain-containing protein [Cytophagaceae bacterium]
MKKNFNIPAKVIYVCCGSKCKKAGGKELKKFFKDRLKSLNMKEIRVIKTGCTDNCKFAPVVCVQPENRWNFLVDEIKAKEIIKDQVIEIHEKSS